MYQIKTGGALRVILMYSNQSVISVAKPNRYFMFLIRFSNRIRLVHAGDELIGGVIIVNLRYSDQNSNVVSVIKLTQRL